MKMSKWVPTTDLMMLRRMGKLQEEMSELGSVAARCIIQGIDEVDPSSGRVNRERLWLEIADVYAQLDETVSRLGLNAADIETRRAEKRGYMREWEAMFTPEHEGVSEALRKLEDWALKGHALYGDDVLRFRALADRIAPETASADDHCTCQGCGNKSTGDLLVPDDVWAKITPKPETPEAGLLCPNCIVQRITDGCIWTALRAHDVDDSPSTDAEDAARYRFAYDGSADFAICRWNPTGGPDHDGDWVSTSEDVIDAARAAKEDKA